MGSRTNHTWSEVCSILGYHFYVYEERKYEGRYKSDHEVITLNAYSILCRQKAVQGPCLFSLFRWRVLRVTIFYILYLCIA